MKRIIFFLAILLYSFIGYSQNRPIQFYSPIVAPSYTPTHPRYWTDTFTVTRVNDSTITFTMTTTDYAVQFCNSQINHILRWKVWNGAIGADSVKCALISQATNVTTTITVKLIGDYFDATDRVTSAAYTVYDKASFYEWYVSGLMVADTNAVGIRRSWDTLKTIRIIASAGRLGQKGTGTIKFAYNLYLGSSPLGGYAIMETNRNYNFDGYLKRTNRPVNARRVVPGGYWITLKTPVASGTTVHQDLYVKLWWIEAKLLDAN